MGPFRSLSARITLALAIGLAVVLLISGGFAQKNISDEIRSVITRVKEDSLVLQAANAGVPLWNLDREQLQTMVNNIVVADDTVYAFIENFTDKDMVVEAGHRPEMRRSTFFVLSHEIIHKHHGQSESLGTLSIVLDYSRVNQQVEIITRQIAVVAGSMLIFVLVAIYFIIHHMVRPVTQLSDQLLSVANNEGVKISTRHISSTVIEVQHLLSALNRLQTSQASYQETLITAKNEAEEASQAKSDFLANMSHELRTPLNSIIGITKMLRDDAPIDSEEREMTSIVYKSGVNLLDIVNDILDLSKIESKRMDLECMAFDLKPIIYNIIETLAPIASKRGLSLHSHFDSVAQLPYIKGDPLRVSRIFMNLVGNAIKYTEKGNVKVLIEHQKIGNNQAEIKCSIIDTGIGIPEDRLSAIFQKFTQADDTTTRRFGGTGLGLTITKDLVELMGGKIFVKSKENEGSTFTVIIPFEITESLDDRPEDVQLNAVNMLSLNDRLHPGDAKILIAEDYALNQSLIKKVLSRMGFNNYNIEDNGALAVKAFKERHYDMILMDCHMPVMNGYEAMEAVRDAEKGTGTHIPIIALTADAMLGTRDKCFAAGADNYVSKPINIDEFEALLNTYFVLSIENKGIKKQHKVQEIVLDLANLNDYADTKEEMIAFCSQLCLSTEADLKILNVHCIDGESQEWVEATHKIKSSAGIAGAHRLQQLAKEAQTMGNASAVQRRSYFDNICIAYQEVKDALGKEGLVELYSSQT